MRFNKRAVSAVALIALIGVVLGVIAIIPLSKIAGGALGMLSARPNDESVVSFSSVLDAAKDMYKPENKDVSICIIPGVLPQEAYAIVGFNKGDLPSLTNPDLKGIVEEPCFDNNVKRQDNCADLACLCLCNAGFFSVSGDDCAGKYCIPLPEVDRIVRRVGDVERDMVLYGKSCGTIEFSTQYPVIIEKDGKKLSISSVTQEYATQVIQGRDVKECSELSKPPENAENVA